MSSPEQAPQGPRRKRRSRRQKAFERRVPLVFSVIVLVCVLVWGIQIELDRPRMEAAVIANVESRGGEVVRIVWAAPRVKSGYAVVLFDGQRSECPLHLLDRDPPVFTCEPAVNR